MAHFYFLPFLHAEADQQTKKTTKKRSRTSFVWNHFEMVDDEHAIISTSLRHIVLCSGIHDTFSRLKFDRARTGGAEWPFSRSAPVYRTSSELVNFTQGQYLTS